MEEDEQSSGMSVATSRMAVNKEGKLQKDMLVTIPKEFIESPDVLFLVIKVDGYRLNLDSITSLIANVINSEFTDSEELILLYERKE